MNPLMPTGYDIFFTVLVILNVFLTLWAIVLINKIDMRMMEKFFAACVMVSLPIIAPIAFIYMYFRTKSRNII